jgi:transposase-like protein
MATKKELKARKELAQMYFMQGSTRKEIAAKIDVSEATVGRWVEQDGWDVKRSATNITRPELVNKILREIDRMLDEAVSSDDTKLKLGLADKLSKFASVIEKLDKKANVVDYIETLTAFNNYLKSRMAFDKEITPELISVIVKYEDMFIAENAKR